MKKMNRHIATVLTVLSAIFVALKSVDAAPQPNIVHIMVDDLGWQDIASHNVDGDAVYETPNLDRLTRQGRRFTQAYSPAPTCAPSRVAFLRGQYPAHTGVYHVMGGRVPRPYNESMDYIPPFYHYGLPVEEPTVAEELKKAGYVNGHVGKWHAGGHSAGYPFPLDQGFDFGYTEFTERGHPRKFYNDSELWDPQERTKNVFFGSWSRMHPNRLADFATADPDDPFQVNENGRPFDKPLDLALGFMRQNKGSPFYLNYCPYYVHGPIQTRDRTRFEHYLEKMGYDFPDNPGPINEGTSGQTNPYYASMVDTVDWMIGEVVKYLETTDDPRNPGHKLIDNTYIVVDSDNGGWIGHRNTPVTDNSPLRGGKQQTYEGGIRIPFIVRGPGVPAGTSCSTPVSLIDLFPTFMAITGLNPDAEDLDLDGCNILPLMKGQAEKAVRLNGEEREAIYWYFPFESHMSYAMRKGKWKLIRNFGIGVGTKEGVQLFRLFDDNGNPDDLGENRDVADKFPEVREAMLAELNAFLAEADVVRQYRNLARASDAERDAAPGVLKQGADGSRVWVDLESGKNKAGIAEARLLYTLNPEPFDMTGGRREEWFARTAMIGEGRVEAVMPPGATHGVFCMRDSNGFLLLSEPVPTYQEASPAVKDSEFFKNGYAYRPGLAALIELGEWTRSTAYTGGWDTAALDAALSQAHNIYQAESASEIQQAEAIRDLRKAIREQDVPQSDNSYINRFPTDPRF